MQQYTGFREGGSDVAFVLQFWVSNDNFFTPDFNSLRLQEATVTIILPGLMEPRLESCVRVCFGTNVHK